MSDLEMKDVMLPGEAAEFLGISIQKLGRLRRDGVIKGEKIEGVNLSVFKLEELRKVKGKIQKKDKPGPKPKNA